MPVVTNSNARIIDSFYNVQNIVVYKQGNVEVLPKGDDKYQLVIDSLFEITENSHEMPAFGVSLDHETREALKTGIWIELEFVGVQEYNGMPFESLLIQVNNNYSGFNLIRRYNGKYEGRCFYLHIENNMQQLYDILVELS